MVDQPGKFMGPEAVMSLPCQQHFPGTTAKCAERCAAAVFAKWLLHRHHSLSDTGTPDAHKCGKCLGFERILMPNQDVTERLRRTGFAPVVLMKCVGADRPAEPV
jgi:hypothetical protein